MSDYAALQDLIWWRTTRAGGLLTTYVALVLSPISALCTLAGLGGALMYLRLLYDDVDKWGPKGEGEGEENAMYRGYQTSYVLRASEVKNPVLRVLAYWGASYRHGITKRLVVPVGLALGMWLYNTYVRGGGAN